MAAADPETQRGTIGTQNGKTERLDKNALRMRKYEQKSAEKRTKNCAKSRLLFLARLCYNIKETERNFAYILLLRIFHAV